MIDSPANSVQNQALQVVVEYSDGSGGVPGNSPREGIRVGLARRATGKISDESLLNNSP